MKFLLFFLFFFDFSNIYNGYKVERVEVIGIPLEFRKEVAGVLEKEMKVFSSSSLKTSISNIEEFLKKKGFLNAKVISYQVVKLRGKKRVEVRFVVYPGKRFIIKSLVFIKKDNVSLKSLFERKELRDLPYYSDFEKELKKKFLRGILIKDFGTSL